MTRDPIKGQQQKHQHNACADEHQPAILFEDGFRLVLRRHERHIPITRRSAAVSGLLRDVLQNLRSPESILISLFHCAPPWLLAVNGTGNKMGRSTCSACANCSCNLSVDSLKFGRSNTITPSARWPGSKRRVVMRKSEMAIGSALTRLPPFP